MVCQTVNPIPGPVNISITRSIVFNDSGQVVDRSAASRSEMKPLKRSVFSLISARTRKWQRAHCDLRVIGQGRVLPAQERGSYH